MAVCVLPQTGWLCSAALALTLIRHTAAHRHSAMPNNRFQSFLIPLLLSNAHSAFGAPEGCGAGPHHNVFCPPAGLDSAAGFLIMVL